jgi:predicted ester cyclase
MTHTMTLKKIAYEPYADPDEFIREVTDRIWVQRDIEHIYDNYEPDSIVHGPAGTAVGVEQVVQGTTMRIAAVPDHIGLAEDVVWEERGDNAFLSSHLVLGIDHVASPEGQRIVRSRTIANCLYREGRMVEEWVVRDSLAQCLQLGTDPAEAAARLPYVGYSGSLTEPAPENPLVEGDSGPRENNFPDECRMVLDMIHHVWTRRNLAKMDEYFDRDVILRTVGDKTVVRPKAYQEDLLELVSAFPDCTVEVRDIQTNDQARYGGLRVAVSWKLSGHYTGSPLFGPLTGEKIDILGASQFQIHEGRIVREVRVFDWVGVLAQIEAGRGEEEFRFDNLY